MTPIGLQQPTKHSGRLKRLKNGLIIRDWNTLECKGIIETITGRKYTQMMFLIEYTNKILGRQFADTKYNIMTLIKVNPNLITKFVFETKLKIDFNIKINKIDNSDDCLDFISNEVEKSNNVFVWYDRSAIKYITEQIFMFYYGDDDINLPINENYTMLAKLN